MRWQDFELFEQVGLTQYERKALVTLMDHGIANADTLCRQGSIPTSKIYLAMEKLDRLGLAETQQTRPRLFSALPPDVLVDRMVDIVQQRATTFAKEAELLRRKLAGLPGALRGRKTFVDLALGVESHVKRHLIQVSAAKRRALSYLERGDIASIAQVNAQGFPILRRLARNAARRDMEHKIVFGFSYQSAPELMAFLQEHRTQLVNMTGVRYSGELGHPFHVVDDDLVILCLDHPFLKEGRFASLLVRDRELAQSLIEGFEALWAKAMHDVREIRFHPGGL